MAGKKADASVEEKPVGATKPVEAPKPSSSSSDDNIFGALCYIITVLVPLFILFTEKKSNKFLAFHAYQGLFLAVIWVVVFGGFSVVTTLLSFVTYGLGGLLGCFMLPLGGVVFLAHLFLAYKAYQGESLKVPVLGDFAEKQANK